MKSMLGATLRRRQSVINHNGRHVHLGTFVDEKDAAIAFDRAAVLCRGAQAKLNFPYSNYVDPSEGHAIANPEIESRLLNAFSSPVARRPRKRDHEDQQQGVDAAQLEQVANLRHVASRKRRLQTSHSIPSSIHNTPFSAAGSQALISHQTPHHAQNLQQQVQAALPPGCQLQTIMSPTEESTTAAVIFNTPSGLFGAGLYHQGAVHASRRFTQLPAAADHCEIVMEVAQLMNRSMQSVQLTTNPTNMNAPSTTFALDDYQSRSLQATMQPSLQLDVVDVPPQQIDGQVLPLDFGAASMINKQPKPEQVVRPREHVVNATTVQMTVPPGEPQLQAAPLQVQPVPVHLQTMHSIVAEPATPYTQRPVATMDVARSSENPIEVQQYNQQAGRVITTTHRNIRPERPSPNHRDHATSITGQTMILPVPPPVKPETQYETKTMTVVPYQPQPQQQQPAYWVIEPQYPSAVTTYEPVTMIAPEAGMQGVPLLLLAGQLLQAENVAVSTAASASFSG